MCKRNQLPGYLIMESGSYVRSAATRDPFILGLHDWVIPKSLDHANVTDELFPSARC